MRFQRDLVCLSCFRFRIDSLYSLTILVPLGWQRLGAFLFLQKRRKHDIGASRCSSSVLEGGGERSEFNFQCIPGSTVNGFENFSPGLSSEKLERMFNGQAHGRMDLGHRSGKTPALKEEASVQNLEWSNQCPPSLGHGSQYCVLIERSVGVDGWISGWSRQCAISQKSNTEYRIH